MNPYPRLTAVLANEQAQRVLAVLCSGELRCSRKLESELSRLEELELARRHLTGWSPTWLGHGLNNWQRQLDCSLWRDPDGFMPEPSADENGEEVGPLCERFRETYFRPGYCWCRRPRHEHPGQLVEIALSWLRFHTRSLKVERLQHPGTSRSLRELCGALGPMEYAVLRVLHSPSVALQLGELALKIYPIGGYFQLKEAVDNLLELELLVLVENNLRSSWEGRRVACWLSEPRSWTTDEPRPNENGIDPLAQPCELFRPLTRRRPVSCWCGWEFAAHT